MYNFLKHKNQTKRQTIVLGFLIITVTRGVFLKNVCSRKIITWSNIWYICFEHCADKNTIGERKLIITPKEADNYLEIILMLEPY